MNVNDYPGRFALVDQSAKDAVQIPADWIWRQSGNLHLTTDPLLPVLEIRSRDGQSMGWMLGYPIDPATATMLFDSLQMPTDSDAFEQELYRLGGRFAAIVRTEKWQRYYPDAAGSLAAFVCGGRNAIASTPTMIRGLEPIEPELSASLERTTQASGTWFPTGLSGFRDTMVILPNHHIDLQTWTMHRHWPVNVFSASSAPKRTVREIFDTLRSTIAAVGKQYPIAMDLTGGHDSRMLLAAALPFTSKIEFRTNLEHSPADGLLSESLSRFFGLKHNNAEIDAHDRVLLRGYGGEVGRCFYWQKCPGGDQPPTAEQLLQGLGFPEPHEAMLTEADRWLASLPKLDRETILDMAYIEHRLGTTMSHVLYNSDTKNRFAMFPLNHRGIYERMMSLPKEFRRQQQLSAEMCRLGSPMLNLFPVNSRHFIGLTKYKKYGSYLKHRGSMNRQQREIVRSYCTRGRSLAQMLRDDLRRSPVATQPSAEITAP